MMRWGAFLFAFLSIALAGFPYLDTASEGSENSLVFYQAAPVRVTSASQSPNPLMARTEVVAILNWNPFLNLSLGKGTIQDQCPGPKLPALLCQVSWPLLC